jgi:hypothetical protein
MCDVHFGIPFAVWRSRHSELIGRWRGMKSGKVGLSEADQWLVTYH